MAIEAATARRAPSTPKTKVWSVDRTDPAAPGRIYPVKLLPLRQAVPIAG